ncbi:GroES-like protein [Peniophora sp. CONT]|nr:GroES-like protein [Peniophora sp. CONT]
MPGEIPSRAPAAAFTVRYTTFNGSASGRIIKKTAEKVVKPTDVVVRITHSGLCGTDVHQRKNDICLGHEGVGVIEAVGYAVTAVKVGDRVGIPVVRATCGKCEACLVGEDAYCPDMDAYSREGATPDLGILASHAVLNETFVIPIPEGLDNRDAGPLFCAGATVFEVLYRYGVRAGDRVGVVGVGGLGHFAIQYARKMGCEVIAFSGTEAKKKETKQLGAHEFYMTKGVEKFGNIKPIDHLLVTASPSLDWDLYFPIMAMQSTIYPLAVAVGARMDIDLLTLVAKGMRVQGSCVAPRSVYHKVISFSAAQGIKPMVEEFPMTEEGIEAAFDALNKGILRYRAVLVAQ